MNIVLVIHLHLCLKSSFSTAYYQLKSLCPLVCLGIPLAQFGTLYSVPGTICSTLLKVIFKGDINHCSPLMGQRELASMILSFSAMQIFSNVTIGNTTPCNALYCCYCCEFCCWYCNNFPKTLVLQAAMLMRYDLLWKSVTIPKTSRVKPSWAYAMQCIDTIWSTNSANHKSLTDCCCCIEYPKIICHSHYCVQNI